MWNDFHCDFNVLWSEGHASEVKPGCYVPVKVQFGWSQADPAT